MSDWFMADKIAAPLDRALLAELASLTTPSVANGIETFNVQPRNHGFMEGSMRCAFPNLGQLLGR